MAGGVDAEDGLRTRRPVASKGLEGDGAQPITILRKFLPK